MHSWSRCEIGVRTVRIVLLLREQKEILREGTEKTRDVACRGFFESGEFRNCLFALLVCPECPGSLFRVDRKFSCTPFRTHVNYKMTCTSATRRQVASCCQLGWYAELYPPQHRFLDIRPSSARYHVQQFMAFEMKSRLQTCACCEDLLQGAMKAGYAWQKALAQMDRSYGDPPRPIYRIRNWQTGAQLYLVGNIMQFLSYAFAAQSLLLALSSVQFATHLLFAWVVEGIAVPFRSIMGSAIVILSNILLVIFSSKSSELLTAKDLLELYRCCPGSHIHMAGHLVMLRYLLSHARSSKHVRIHEWIKFYLFKVQPVQQLQCNWLRDLPNSGVVAVDGVLCILCLAALSPFGQPASKISSCTTTFLGSRCIYPWNTDTHYDQGRGNDAFGLFGREESARALVLLDCRSDTFGDRFGVDSCNTTWSQELPINCHIASSANNVYCCWCDLWSVVLPRVPSNVKRSTSHVCDRIPGYVQRHRS